MVVCRKGCCFIEIIQQIEAKTTIGTSSTSRKCEQNHVLFEYADMRVRSQKRSSFKLEANSYRVDKQKNCIAPP